MTRDMNALMLNIKSNNAILMKKVIVTFVVDFLNVHKDNRNSHGRYAKFYNCVILFVGLKPFMS